VVANSYNWSVTDQSPLVAYSPHRSGDNETTWNSTYSLSPWSDYGDEGYSGIIGEGVSSHSTSADSATAKIGFTGTAVYVWGECYELSAIISVDGVSRGFSTGATGQIGSATNLSNTWHDVEVVVRGLGTVQLEGFTFTSEYDGWVLSQEGCLRQNACERYNRRCIGEREGDSELDGFVVSTILNGSRWYSLPKILLIAALTGEMVNYTTLSVTADSNTSISLTPPLNTTMVYIYGLVDPYSIDKYTVTTIGNSESSSTPAVRVFNASSDWIGANQVLFQTQLVPGTQGQITISFDDSASAQSSGFNIGSVVYVQVPK